MTTPTQNSLIISALLLATPILRAQLTYSADAQTDPTSAVRLYLDTAESTPAPVGTTLWFVADLSGNGVPSGQVSASQIQDISSGVGDDRLFFTDIVDGILLGSQSGKYKQTGISVPNSFQTASIGLILWNDANHDGTIGDAGDTFGYYNFGVVSPPALGNAQYLITANVHADVNVVVPEPAGIGVAFGLVCLAGALTRRTLRRVSRISRFQRLFSS